MSTLFHKVLSTYRASLKRVPLIHRILYFSAQKLVLPLIERQRRFWTIPDDPVNFRLKLLLDKWEPETVNFFRRYIKPGMLVLDIGAHIGYYTRLFSQLVGPEGLVIAFEPHPVHFSFLQRNVLPCKNVKLVNKALGNENEVLTFYDYDVGSGSASLAVSEEKLAHSRHESAGEMAPRVRSPMKRQFKVMVSILDFEFSLMKLSYSVDFVKIDVEGAEVSVLEGAQNVLTNSNAKIVFEVAPANLRAFGHSPEVLFDRLTGFGLKFFYVLLDSGEAKNFSIQDLLSLCKKLSPDEFINCVACKERLVNM